MYSHFFKASMIDGEITDEMVNMEHRYLRYVYWDKYFSREIILCITWTRRRLVARSASERAAQFADVVPYIYHYSLIHNKFTITKPVFSEYMTYQEVSMTSFRIFSSKRNSRIVYGPLPCLTSINYGMTAPEGRENNPSDGDVSANLRNDRWQNQVTLWNEESQIKFNV